tara:strand:- start:145 stop:525 length:381 start_codon:yes stop_codon:yes gene_type:complete
MTLFWKQLVCHGLLTQIGEPEVVKYILKIAIKERCAYLSEESREFYSKHMKFVLYCRYKQPPLRRSDPLDKIEKKWREKHVPIGHLVYLAVQRHIITFDELKSSFREARDLAQLVHRIATLNTRQT